MELNLLIIFLYLFKNFKFRSFKNKSIYEKFKNNFYDNSEYIFDININEKKCCDLNYSKLIFLYNFINYFKNIFLYIKFNSPTFLRIFNEFLNILYIPFTSIKTNFFISIFY